MNIQFELTKTELLNLTKEELEKRLKRGILSSLLISIPFGYLISIHPNGEIIWDVSNLFYTALLFILIILFFLFPQVLALLKLRKLNSNFGFSLTTENIKIENLETKKQKIIEWKNAKFIHPRKNDYLLNFKNFSTIQIPKSHIKEEDLAEIVSIIKNNHHKNSYPLLLYIFTLVPYVRFIAGCLFMYSGMKKNNQTSIIWGIIGILSTPIFWFGFPIILDWINKI